MTEEDGKLTKLEDELERYDWRRFKSFLGDASSLPAAILDLVSAGTDEAAQLASWRIDNVAMVQGRRLSQSAEPLSACLVKAVPAATEAARRYLLDLIATIVNGYDDHVDITKVGPVSMIACVEPIAAALDLFEIGLAEQGDPICVEILASCASYDRGVRERVAHDFRVAMTNPACVRIRNQIEVSLLDIEGD